jgi:eukaryotic-like serine/threonine-protein kinase
MTTPEPDKEIAQQRELLATYRRTLAHLLQQAAQYGGVSFAPPQTANGITEARAQIAQIKTSLRAAGVEVEHELNDEAPATEPPPLAAPTTFNQPNWSVSGNVYNVAGDQTNIHTDGGDYAGRDLDKRQGSAFIENSVVQGDVVGGDKVAGDKVLGDKIAHHHYYQATTPPLDQQQQRNRRAMLEKVKTIWIKGLLEQSLVEVVKIDLGLENKPGAVDIPLHLQYQELNRQPRPIPGGTPIIDVFTQMGGALLVMGAPGAGKTTLLLELARDLIARAKQDESHPIPVVFNLSSWATKRQPLKDWLSEELNTRYEVPRKLAQEWMDADAILPLLDGLDEVAEDHRISCVDAINLYRQEHGLVPLAVCSRVADYEALTTKLRLQGAVLVNTLTQQQVDAYLEQAGEKLAGVQAALGSDATLRELSETPLMLSVMTLAYQGMTAEKLPVTGPINERRTHLFEAYVNRMFRRRVANARHPHQQTIRWLCWLAQAMSRHAQTTFFLERLQPNYLTNRSQCLQYAVGEGLAWGVFAGFAAVIANGLVVLLGALTQWWGAHETPWLGHYIRSGLLGGLIGGLAGGLIGGLIARLTFNETELRESNDEAEPKELNNDRRMSSIRNALRVGITVGLAIGMARGLAVEWATGDRAWALARGLGWGIGYGLAVGLGYGLVTRPGRIDVVEILSWSWSKARTQIIRALRYGIIVGLAVGLAVGIVNGIIWDLGTGVADGLVLWLAVGIETSAILLLIWGVSVGEINRRTMPNQGIWRSAGNALRFGVAMWLTGGIIMTAILSPFPTWGPSYSLSFGIGGGFVLILIGGLLYGGIACLQHFVLHSVLWHTQKIPWRYISFLDYCVDLIFLRRVGGGYIFVHRLLMEHFASLNTTQTGESQQREN